MKIKAFLDIGYTTATRTKVLELDDGLTEQEIWDEVDAWAEQYINKGYDVIDNEKTV